MNNINLLLIAIFLFFSCQLSAQDCVKTDYYGTEHNVNCGGDNCVECMVIPFNLLCDGSGQVSVIVSISSSVLSVNEEEEGYYIEATGNFNDQIDESGQFIIFNESEGTPLSLRFEKYDSNDNLVAIGEINELSPPCSKGTDGEDCPDNSDFDVEAEIVYFSDSYMVKYTMMNGVKPYQVYDNELGQFYTASVFTDDFYLGNFKYGTFFSTTIVDADGCSKTFIVNGGEPTVGTSTLSVNNYSSTVFCSPNPVLNNSSFNVNIAVKEQGNYNIDIYNLAGKEVSSLTLNNLDVGNEIINMNNINLTNGVYVLSLKNSFGKTIATNKLVVLN